MRTWGLSPARTLSPKPVEWSWPNRIAKRKMNIIAGEGKKGKTQMVLAMAAITSMGGEWPDGSGRAEKGTVIILSAEDDPEDTLAPRLIALGADMSKIKIIRGDFIIRRTGKEPEINPIDFQRLSLLAGPLQAVPGPPAFHCGPGSLIPGSWRQRSQECGHPEHPDAVLGRGPGFQRSDDRGYASRQGGSIPSGRRVTESSGRLPMRISLGQFTSWPKIPTTPTAVCS